MILGVGTDIVQVNRINKLYAKYGDKIARKILHAKEIDIFNQVLNLNKKIAYLAKRFCAKEAFVKAIGTGFNNKVFLSDFCIVNDKLGKPYYDLSFNVDQYIKSVFKVQSYKIHLTISDDTEYAVAFAIIERV